MRIETIAAAAIAMAERKINVVVVFATMAEVPDFFDACATLREPEKMELPSNTIYYGPIYIRAMSAQADPMRVVGMKARVMLAPGFSTNITDAHAREWEQRALLMAARWGGITT